MKFCEEHVVKIPGSLQIIEFFLCTYLRRQTSSEPAFVQYTRRRMESIYKTGLVLDARTVITWLNRKLQELL